MATPARVSLVLRYDDVCSPESDARSRSSLRASELALLRIHTELGIPAVFAVVPEGVGESGEDLAMTEELRRACAGGNEVALHGCTHQNTLVPSGSAMARAWARLCKRTCSEFAGLTAPEQRTRMVEGKRRLELVFGCAVTSFVPPWNSYDAATMAACRHAGIAAISASRAWPVPTVEGIAMIPQTTGHENLEAALHFALRRRRPALVVCVLHVWDFAGDGRVGTLTLDSWEQRLGRIAADPRIVTTTLDGARRDLADRLSCARLRRHRLQSALLRMAAGFIPGRGLSLRRASYLLD